MPYAIGARLAGAMGVDIDRVTVRATTTDELGFTGRGEGSPPRQSRSCGTRTDMALQFPTRAERPARFRHAGGPVGGAWPEFMYHDTVLNRLGRVIEESPEFQLLRLGRRARRRSSAGEHDPRGVGRELGEPARRGESTPSSSLRFAKERRRADRSLRAADPDRSRLPRPASQPPHDRAMGEIGRSTGSTR